MRLRARVKENTQTKNVVHIEVRKKSGEVIRQKVTNTLTDYGRFYLSGCARAFQGDVYRGFTRIWVADGDVPVGGDTYRLADTGATRHITSGQLSRGATQRFEVVEGQNYSVWTQDVEFFAQITSLGGLTVKQVGLAQYSNSGFSNTQISAGTTLQQQIVVEPGDSLRVEYEIWMPVPDDLEAARNEPVGEGVVTVIRRDLDDSVIGTDDVDYTIVRRRCGRDNDIEKIHSITDDSYSSAYILVGGSWVSCPTTTNTSIAVHATAANRFSDKRCDIASEITFARQGAEGTTTEIHGMRLYYDGGVASSDRGLIQINFAQPIVKGWTDSLKLNFEMEVTW